MTWEIERKFLLANETWRSQVHDSRFIAQAYLGGDNCSVRLRLDGDEANINIKGLQIGDKRREFEYAIPVTDARLMIEEFAGGRCVEKTRHLVDYVGKTWEIDEFSGANQGLVVAEIELENQDEVFAKPSWLGREVTDEAGYYNIRLLDTPFSTWDN